MIRHSTKLTAIAAVALLGSATALNCSKGSSPSGVGDVKLAFTIPGGLTINQVSYIVLSSSSSTLLSGTINTTDKNATVSLDFALQPSQNDTITLTATAQPGNLSCTGTSTPFNIVAGQPTTVSMGMNCGGGSQSSAPGSVIVNASVTAGDNCPSITSATVAPAQTSVGSTIAVAAVGTDPDAAESVVYSWGPAANFAAPTSASTSYTCTTVGTQTITLTISDTHVPMPCSTQIIFPVNCVANGAVCGNGIVEAGEQCDPPNGTTCDANCQTIVSTGTAGAGGGTAGAGGSTGGSTGTAGAGGSTGGSTGTAGAGGSTGGSTGTAGAGGSTGGSTGTAGAGGSTGGSMGTGGSMVVAFSDSAACIQCEFTGTNTDGNCFGTWNPSNSNDGTSVSSFGCHGFTGTDLTNCLALQDCLTGSACQTAIHSATSDYGESQVNFDNALPCLCGNVPLATCLASSSWAGVCQAQFVAAAGGASNVLGNFSATNTAEGVAVNLMSCTVDEPCTTQCSVNHQ